MITPNGDVDYITICNTLRTGQQLVVIMHYRKSQDDYIQTRCSEPCKLVDAERLAELWAKSTGLEIRR